MAQIPYTKPSITQIECDFVADAVATGWGDNCYRYIERFESEFANYIGTKYAVATSSCTGALTLCLAAINLIPGDEVILADTNWVATVAPIVHLGATPVFVDILSDSWCIDPNEVRAVISPRTKAIIATHLYGNLADISTLKSVAEEFDLILIEDAAEAIGSRWGGNHAGSIGHFGVFSFHGSKTLTTGEGGCLVTNDPRLHERVQTLSNHGRSKTQTKQFWPDEIGYKFKMSNMQAALGCAQLSRIEELVSRKREILKKYKKAFRNFGILSMNPEPIGTTNGAWMPTVVFEESSGITREKLQSAFNAADIDARIFFWPISSLPPFSGNSARNAKSISSRAINLPSFHDMTDKDIDLVSQVIFDIASAELHA